MAPQLRSPTRLVALCALLFATPAAVAQERVELKYNLKDGQSWAFDAKQEFTVSMTATMNGQVVQQVEQGTGQRREGVAHVLAARDGVATAVRVEFGRESGGSMTQGGQKQEMPFALAGKTVTVRKGNDGQVTTEGADGADPATLAEVKAVLDPDTDLFPKKPVAVGDTWEPEVADIAKQFQLGPNDKVTVTCKLLAVGSIYGRKTADIGITGRITKAEGPAEMTIDLGGVSQVDLETGQTLQSDVIGKIGLKGGGQQPGPGGQPVQLNLTGGGQMGVHQTMKPREGGGVAVGPNPNPNPGPLPPLPPVTPVAPAPAGAQAFAGAFKGDKLSVDLAAGTGDALTGTITLGDQRFPATATFEGGKLTGTFQAGDDKFPFTASLDGNTLTLTSGGTDYTMKKAGANNPLGGGATGGGKKNPL